MFLLNVMLFLKVLRVIAFLNILLVASIMPSGDTNNSTEVISLIYCCKKILLSYLFINPNTFVTRKSV